jgi:RNA polymerase sigma-32 factor
MTKAKASTPKSTLPVRLNIVDQYLQEISRYPLITKEQEYELARRYQETQDPTTAHALVTANLRFVVKIAYEYRNFNIKLIDLIQEGNIGLMMAVKKFNAERGYRLISYAVWWIKAYMQNFIIKNWSMSKIPLGRKNRMLLSEIMRKDRSRGDESDEQRAQLVDELVFEGEFEKKEDVRRVLDQMILAARDFYLDQEVDSESSKTFMSMLASNEEGQDELIARGQLKDILARNLAEILPTLSDKERFILKHRILEDEPRTLQEIGDRFQISRERVRQIENNLKKKLKKKLSTQDVAIFLE